MGKNKKLLRFKDYGLYIFSLCFLFLLVGCKQEAVKAAEQKKEEAAQKAEAAREAAEAKKAEEAAKAA